jgi:hypothetical protein
MNPTVLGVDFAARSAFVRSPALAFCSASNRDRVRWDAERKRPAFDLESAIDHDHRAAVGDIFSRAACTRGAR